MMNLGYSLPGGQIFVGGVSATQSTLERKEYLGNAQVFNVNGALVKGNHNTVTGNHNEIIGEDNVINGHHNRVIGVRSKVKGRHNTVEGNSAEVTGDFNSVKGNECRVVGKHCSSNGVQVGSTDEATDKTRIATSSANSDLVISVANGVTVGKGASFKMKSVIQDVSASGYTMEQIKALGIRLPKLSSATVGSQMTIARDASVDMTSVIKISGTTSSSVAVETKSKLEIYVRAPLFLVRMNASSGDSVLSVKAKVLAEEGVSVDQQRLYFDGKEMEDARTLAEYKVTDKSTLLWELRSS